MRDLTCFPHLTQLVDGPHRQQGVPPSGPVAAALDAIRPERLVAVLQDLLRIPSVTGSPAESEAQHVLAGHLQGLGLDTDLWAIDLPTMTADPEFPGLESPREDAYGLVGTWPGTDPDGLTLVLNGHIDVVPPGDPVAWSTPPWRGAVESGRVYGRGACDMKGGLACQLVALEALRQAGVSLRGSVQLQSVVGEEDGGLGTFATLRRGYTGDLAVVCEPTSTDIIAANGGALTFRLSVPGKAVHASVRRDGVDAIDKYLLLHAALRRLEARRNADVHPLMRTALPYPLSIGTLRAGDWASSVPDLLVAEGRLGVALGEPVAKARADLEQTVDEVCSADPWLAGHPARVDWFGGQFASSLLPEHHPLQTLVSGAHSRVTGRAPQVLGASWGSDIRLLTDIGGIPALHYGPGNIRRAHAPDEYVPVDELVVVTSTLVMLVAEACGEA